MRAKRRKQCAALKCALSVPVIRKRTKTADIGDHCIFPSYAVHHTRTQRGQSSAALVKQVFLPIQPFRQQHRFHRNKSQPSTMLYACQSTLKARRASRSVGRHVEYSQTSLLAAAAGQRRGCGRE
uniref:Uncharacterized protein n=1 Tax=Rhipicephalus zambeziensis TaxID=60191 RepID=A0A224Y9P2_9ACAR